MRRRLAISVGCVAAALLGAGLQACGDDDALSSLASSGAGGGAPDAGTGGGGAASDGGKPKRTVEQRNPFGDVAETQNLLWDGDFEWFSAFSDQYGWISGGLIVESYALPTVVVGPQCKSGVKCASIAPGQGVLGLAVGAEAQPLDVSVWVSGAPQDCSAVDVVLTSVFTLGPGDPSATIAADGPAVGGWCHFHGVVGPRTKKPALYIGNQGATATLVVDDAVVKAAPGAEPTTLARRLTPDSAARVEAACAAARRQMTPHDPPPNAARRAFEAWRHKPEGAR